MPERSRAHTINPGRDVDIYSHESHSYRLTATIRAFCLDPGAIGPRIPMPSPVQPHSGACLTRLTRPVPPNGITGMEAYVGDASTPREPLPRLAARLRPGPPGRHIDCDDWPDGRLVLVLRVLLGQQVKGSGPFVT